MSEDGARRFWTYSKDSWSGGPIQRGGDEYGNSTIVLRLPGGRAFIMAYNWPLRRELEPVEGRIEYGLVDPDATRTGDATWDNPLPLASEHRFDPPPDGCVVVTRTLRVERWRVFDRRLDW